MLQTQKLIEWYKNGEYGKLVRQAFAAGVSPLAFGGDVHDPDDSENERLAKQVYSLVDAEKLHDRELPDNDLGLIEAANLVYQALLTKE